MRLGALGEAMDSPWVMQVLLGITNLSKGNVLEDDADILWVELIVFRADAISRIDS